MKGYQCDGCKEWFGEKPEIALDFFEGARSRPSRVHLHSLECVQTFVGRVLADEEQRESALIDYGLGYIGTRYGAAAEP